MARARVLALALLLTACGSASPAGSLPSNASQSPSSAAPPTPDQSAAAIPIIDLGVCCMGTMVAPGTYRSPYVWTIAIALTVPDGWRAFRTDRANGGVVALVRGEGNEIDHATEYLAFFPIPSSEPIIEFVEGLRSTPFLHPASNQELTVAGSPATAFDATSESNPAVTGDDDVVAGALDFPTINEIFAPYRWRSESPGAQFRFIVVEGPGGGLLIYLEAPPAQFEALASDAQPVIDSVTFLE